MTSADRGPTENPATLMPRDNDPEERTEPGHTTVIRPDTTAAEEGEHWSGKQAPLGLFYSYSWSWSVKWITRAIRSFQWFKVSQDRVDD